MSNPDNDGHVHLLGWASGKTEEDHRHVISAPSTVGVQAHSHRYPPSPDPSGPLPSVDRLGVVKMNYETIEDTGWFEAELATMWLPSGSGATLRRSYALLVPEEVFEALQARQVKLSRRPQGDS